VTAEPGAAAPPAAARIRAERTHHGDTVIDEYSWLAAKEKPETIAFLEAENAYTQALTAGQAPLEVYRYMKSYSPYENVATDRDYPPVLAVTSLNDTRVLYTDPAKWIARLQAEVRGGPFLLRTEMAAGHGGRSGRYDAWHEEALVLAWIVATAVPA
jgi:protease II